MPALPWMFFAIVVLLVSVGHADLIRIDHFLVNGGVMQGLQYYRNLLGV